MLEVKGAQFQQAIFYRGISLKEYLKKKAEQFPSLSYKDDQTIFVDQDQNPLYEDSSLIFAGQETPTSHVRPSEILNLYYQDFSSRNDKIYLPSIHARKKAKVAGGKNSESQRKSTDASIQNQQEMTAMLLPNISRRRMARERNITMASCSSSRSVSCRKKMVNDNTDLRQSNQLRDSKERRSSPGKRLRKGVSVDEGKLQINQKKEDSGQKYYKVRNIKLRALQKAF